MCGENGTPLSAEEAREGSSPRVRGKLGNGAMGLLGSGLIPACAGKTRARLGWVAGPEAHPRVCGENPELVMLDEAFAGSSPRVRGKPRRSCCSMDNRGLIPACAGKTNRPAVREALQGAHPRVCGEN